ncbi:MAG: hypothetical protein IKK14_02800 [Oscillospiraceae bacterium]|nr:hypothetical protein [Oscillospiraceae bacterium]
MAKIMMKKAHNESISEAFEGFMLSAQSRDSEAGNQALWFKKTKRDTAAVAVSLFFY